MSTSRLFAPSGPIAGVVLVAIAYAAAGRAGLLLAIPPGYATAVWPASGIALAALLVGGNRLWPGVLLGSIAVNISTSWDPSTQETIFRSLLLAVTIAAGAALEALAGAWLIRRFVGYTNILLQEVGATRLLLLGGPVACTVNATFGVTALWAAGLVPGSSFLFNWWTWWVGDSIGVVIFTPLVLVWAPRPWNSWLRKRAFITVPLLLMFSAVVWLFFFTSQREESRLRAAFDKSIEAPLAEVRDRLDRYFDTLLSIERLYAASHSVDRGEFERFSARLVDRMPGVLAMSFNRVVDGAQRAAYEAQMRAEGLPDFAIREFDAQGRLQLARPRPHYVVIERIAPEAANQRALGVDVASDLTRRKTLELARISGTAQASPEIRLVQDETATDGMLIYLAVGDRAAPVGYVAIVVRFGRVLAPLERLGKSGILASVRDMSAQHALPVFSTRRASRSTGGFTRTEQISWSGRAWEVEFALPGAYLTAHRSWEAWSLLAAGLAFTGLMGMFLLAIAGREAKVEQLVVSQTAELRSIEQRFRGLLESAPDALVVVDANGAIELVNAQAEAMFRYSRAEMIGQRIELLIPERLRDAHPGHRNGYRTAPRARPMGAGLHLLGRRKDGSEFPVEISLGPLQQGEHFHTMATVRDISERRDVEQKLARYAAELERSNEELEQFAYAASHDLQAPLRGIIGFTQLLQRGQKGKVDTATAEYTTIIVDSAKHMQTLISDMLAFARVGREHAAQARVDCEVALAQVLGQLRALIEERHAEVTHDPLPAITATSLVVSQLFLNLVSNGLKFQPGAKPRVHVSAKRGDNGWTFSVRDWGIGIAPAQQARIFQIFKRLHTQEEYPGTGVGLAICKKIIDRQGGRIWTESEPGNGSTFFFTWPDASPGVGTTEAGAGAPIA